MKAKVEELYKATLLRHAKDETFRGTLEDATHDFLIRNPLCGDELRLYLNRDDETVAAIRYQAQCCSICAASASMLAHVIPGQSRSDAQQAARSLINHLSARQDTIAQAETLPGDLEALDTVRAFPSRIRCATLPWEALLATLA